MDIKTLILKKFSKRKSATNRGGGLQKSQPPEAKQQHLVALIEETILPRLITVASANHTLEIRAADGKALSSSCTIGKAAALAIDFSNEDVPGQARAKMAATLNDFLEISEDCTITFSEIKPRERGKKGITANSLFSAPKLLKLSSRARPSEEKPTPEQQAGEASLPFRLLAQVRADVTDARYYTSDPKVVPAENAGAEVLENAAPFVALHKKLSGALGSPLLFVAMAHNTDQDTFAFALDENEGAVVELNRQRLGRLCLAWNKLRDE